jgi:deoxyribose-phosphate aldolase
MRGVVGARAGVKASGGIRTLADASAMLHAGASRIGASASVKILAELAAKSPPAATIAS